MRGTVSKNFLESTDTFSISFGGEKEIDAIAFTKIIQETVNILQASSNSICDAHSSYGRTNIKANREGSFETVLQMVFDNQDSLYATTNVACSVISAFCDYFYIKQHLRGKKPKEVAQVDAVTTKIVNHCNQIITADSVTVNNFFQTPSIDNSISRIAKEASAIKRKDMTIKHGDKTLSISEDDYNDMSKPVVEELDMSNSRETKQVCKNCLLHIKKPDLIGASQWAFIYDKIIEAKILDDSFLKSIREGIKIDANTFLICDLQIVTYVDNLNMDLIRSEYAILKVHKIKYGNDQSEFNFDESD